MDECLIVLCECGSECFALSRIKIHSLYLVVIDSFVSPGDEYLGLLRCCGCLLLSFHDLTGDGCVRGKLRHVTWRSKHPERSHILCL